MRSGTQSLMVLEKKDVGEVEVAFPYHVADISRKCGGVTTDSSDDLRWGSRRGMCVMSLATALLPPFSFHHTGPFAPVRVHRYYRYVVA